MTAMSTANRRGSKSTDHCRNCDHALPGLLIEVAGIRSRRESVQLRHFARSRNACFRRA
jgi:hypothetical protein